MSYKKVDSDNCDLYNFPLPKLSEAELQKRKDEILAAGTSTTSVIWVICFSVPLVLC